MRPVIMGIKDLLVGFLVSACCAFRDHCMERTAEQKTMHPCIDTVSD